MTQKPRPQPRDELGDMRETLAAFRKQGPCKRSFLEYGTSDHQEWRQETLAFLQEKLGVVLNPLSVTGTIEWQRVEDGVQFERVRFDNDMGESIAAYVAYAENQMGPMPAVVVNHDQGCLQAFGKEKVFKFKEQHPIISETQEANYNGWGVANELAKRGYLAISIDALGFGERAVVDDAYFQEKKKHYTSLSIADCLEYDKSCSRGFNRIVDHLELAGQTWTGRSLMDDMATVSYLLGRDDVDNDRIGCMGLSVGGYRTNYLMACDDRIHAGISLGWMTEMDSHFEFRLSGHLGRKFLIQGLYHQLDMPDIISLSMPRHLMVVSPSQDHLFTENGMLRAHEKIAAAYTKAGLTEYFESFMPNVGHCMNQEIFDKVFDFFDHNIKA